MILKERELQLEMLKMKLKYKDHQRQRELELEMKTLRSSRAPDMGSVGVSGFQGIIGFLDHPGQP